MLQLSIMSFSALLGTLFFFLSHPLAVGVTLIVQVILMCLITGFLFHTFWFSYVLALIFLGGMLVLFIYVIVLAANEMFTLSVKLTAFFFLALTALLSMSMIYMKFSVSMEASLETLLSSEKNISAYENLVTLSKLYSFPSCMITLMLVLYLLITLIAAVKVTSLFYGPLRKMN